MKVRVEQMTVFAEDANRGFERRLAMHLREVHGDLPVHTATATVLLKSVEESELLAMIQGCIARARKRGMQWESSVAAFAVLMFLNGPNFDRHPAIRAELGNSSVPAESVPDHLATVIPESVWQQIRAGYRGGWEENARGVQSK